jgi:hypothetical protein
MTNLEMADAMNESMRKIIEKWAENGQKMDLGIFLIEAIGAVIQPMMAEIAFLRMERDILAHEINRLTKA